MNKHDYVAPKKPIEHKSYKPITKPDRKLLHQAIELMDACQAAGLLHTGRRRDQFRPGVPSRLLAQLVHMTGFPITTP